MRRARATRWSVVMLVAIFVATLGVTAAPTAVLAADEVSVVGSGQVSLGSRPVRLVLGRRAR